MTGIAYQAPILGENNVWRKKKFEFNYPACPAFPIHLSKPLNYKIVQFR